jgi:hypothetical protein
VPLEFQIGAKVARGRPSAGWLCSMCKYGPPNFQAAFLDPGALQFGSRCQVLEVHGRLSNG